MDYACRGHALVHVARHHWHGDVRIEHVLAHAQLAGAADVSGMYMGSEIDV